MNMIRWDVYYRDELIDSVWFARCYDALDVVNSLVCHDGYPSNIHVQKGA